MCDVDKTYYNFSSQSDMNNRTLAIFCQKDGLEIFGDFLGKPKQLSLI